jgi:hypothetical protein
MRQWYLTLVALSVATVPMTVFADSARDQYEMREKCGKLAREWFKKEWGDGISNTASALVVTNFQNHYSGRYNTCFMELESTSTAKGGKSAGSFHSITLWDMNDNKDYGSFMESRHRVACTVENKTCRSLDEWNELIKPYMNDEPR